MFALFPDIILKSSMIRSRNSIKLEWINKTTNCGPNAPGEGVYKNISRWFALPANPISGVLSF